MVGQAPVEVDEGLGELRIDARLRPYRPPPRQRGQRAQRRHHERPDSPSPHVHPSPGNGRRLVGSPGLSSRSPSRLTTPLLVVLPPLDRPPPSSSSSPRQLLPTPFSLP